MVSSCSAELINNRMVGNSLDRMFSAQSSYLGIDTIFIKNNSSTQLIRIVECNVSFESMKIRENNETCGIISAENSAGKMVNTDIENSDIFLAAAFTATCTYFGNRYFTFEIINTEIKWKYEGPVSAQPIIQSSGNVSLSNVKLLVTSLFETEILQYSTKDVLLSVKGNLKTFPNIYNISSLFIVFTLCRGRIHP